jgi:GNAT superfamily N-acetyltransferase
MAPHFRLRNGRRSDAETILRLIRGLAEFEKMSDLVLNTKRAILNYGFNKNPLFHVLLCEVKTGNRWTSVGFALYFYTYSTFTGKPSLYLEDLFVQPEQRSNGYGKKLFLRVAEMAVKKGCGRMEWSVLAWNRRAMDFYQDLGAASMDEWCLYRLDEQALAALLSGAPE